MVNTNDRKVDGLLFDKDGTLFDFHATWSTWGTELIEELTDGDPALRGTLAREIHFDLDTNQFLPSSPMVAHTHRECAEYVARALPGSDVDELEHQLMLTAAKAALAPAVPLSPFLADLAGRGMALGVVTNDTEFTAHAHLGAAGVTQQFDFIAGFDSGFGAKPDPGPLLAFAEAVGLDPARVAMVGDSTHDLMAGRAAGMVTLGVLTGTALADELAPFADAVLPDIGHIPAWLEA